MLSDLLYAFRRLRQRPGFTLVALLTLALGIGANSAVFSVVNAVLLAPLPYPQADQLVALAQRTRNFSRASVSYPNFEDWQRLNHSFTGLAAYRGDDFVLAGGSGSALPQHLHGMTVSANFFSVLGVKLLAGPGLSPAEDRTGGAPQVVISYPLWQSRFAGAADLVGQTAALNGSSAEIVGILPRDFWFAGAAAQVFTPLGQILPRMLHQRDVTPGTRVVGRLRPGVTLAAAGGDMAAIAGQLAARYPASDGGTGVDLSALKENLVASTRPALLLLLGAVGLVLLIACANVASLLLAQARARHREMALRQALGASGARILRQLLTESLLLGLGGGTAGLALAAAAVRAAPALLPADLPRVGAIHLGGPVLAFTLGAALLSSLLFGLLPAWWLATFCLVAPVGRLRTGFDCRQRMPAPFMASPRCLEQSRRVQLQAALQSGGRSASGTRHPSQNALVIGEFALALILLAAAGLLLQTLARISRIAPGFSSDHLLTMQVALAPGALANGAQAAAAHQALLERVARLPGIAAAAETNLLPLSGNDDEWEFWKGGATRPPRGQIRTVLAYVTSPGYRATMQIPLLRGRFFNNQDRNGHQQVVVLDASAARDFFGDRDPIGQHLFESSIIGDVEVVGVVGHVKHWGLAADAGAKVQDQIYYPLEQIPLPYMTQAGQGFSLVVRSSGDPEAVLPAVRRAVAGPQHDQPVYGIATMRQIMAGALAQQRFLMLLLGLFAGLALTLAAIGIYGVLSYSVAQRRQEMGIRMALGARPADLLRLVVGEAARLALAGVAAGVAGALATTRLLAATLYGVSPDDPATLAAVALLLLAVALLASYLPARRAARADPALTLRGE